MTDVSKEIELRTSANFRLLQNPNYFGNLSQLDLKGLQKPVLKKIQDVAFEELTCIGYNPDSSILTAIVRIKQADGYGGGPCTDGSQEYVRFYLEYGDGVWVDSGVNSFNIHDLGFKDDLCYAVSIKVDPKKRTCCDRDPVLPTVRAVLSWNVVPPANMPNWLPIWGNRLERDIQINPRSPFLCNLIDHITDIGVQQIDPKVLQQATSLLETQLVANKPAASLAQLMKKTDRADKMQVLRNVFPTMVKLAADSTDIAASQTMAAFQIPDFDIDLSDFDDFIMKPDFNTTYEELHCVGLDRDTSHLHGVIEIKRASGYSGDLCSQGSREYVAFYLDFGSGWEFQGITWVDVHNIDQIPDDGLWYQASLPVDLDDHRKEWCKTGQARIRGILSWAVPPAPNDPDFVPHWGDRADCTIEVEHLPKGGVPGQFLPFLESIGNMPIPQINAMGYANGAGVGGIIPNADDAPFGGRTLLKGRAFNIPAGAMEYRIMIQGPSDIAPRAYTNPFEADVTTFPSPFSVKQTVNAVGDWFPYLAASPLVSVADDLLGALTGLENGLHSVFIEFRQPAGPVLGTTVSTVFMVDNTRPGADVEITSGAGNCGKFGIGEVISGTYSMTGNHCGSLRIHVTPLPEAAGGTMVITSAAPAATVLPPFVGGSSSVTISYAAGSLSTDGASGNWELDTTGMDPCGYNIRIHVSDRTILNSGPNNWTNGDIEGFCLDG